LQHENIQDRRVKGVGEWLIRTEEFRRWCGLGGEGGGDGSVLFCYGDPGVGKTFIRYQGLFIGDRREIVLTGCHDSSLVVDRLRDESRELNTIVTCFYFDFTARKAISVTDILGSLLKQIIREMEIVPEEISRGLREHKDSVFGGYKQQLVGIVQILQLITSSQPTFICIDALDECTGVQLARVLESLKQVLDKSPRTRIFLTGRPHIRAEIEGHLSGRVASVYVGPNKDDFITYIRARLANDKSPNSMDECLKEDILNTLGNTSET